jgi:hypothetical protein
MATNVDAQICVRRDTAANWTSANPTLLNGEVGYDTTNNKIKIGNGSSLWSALPYLTDATGGSLTVNTQEFVYAATPVNWVKPAGAVWTYVTMCGAGCDGPNFTELTAGSAGMTAQKLFVSSLLPATVVVLPGLNMPFGSGTNVLASSFFGDPAGVVYLAAAGQYGGANDADAGIDVTTINLSGPMKFGQGAGDDSNYNAAGSQGYAQGPGGGGTGGSTEAGYGLAGGAGGRAGTNAFISTGAAIQRGGGNAGGPSGATGGNGASGGYDTVTGFGHGGGGGGAGTAGVGGNGGDAVRGGGGGAPGNGTSGLGLPGAGGTGYVRVTTICFN